MDVEYTVRIVLRNIFDAEELVEEGRAFDEMARAVFADLMRDEDLHELVDDDDWSVLAVREAPWKEMA